MNDAVVLSSSASASCRHNCRLRGTHNCRRRVGGVRVGLPTALSSERTDGHFSGGRERTRAVVAATRHARTGPGRLTEKQIIAFCLSPDLAMVFNTKKIERELKIQKASKFFVNCKRREKKYKKQLLRRPGVCCRNQCAKQPALFAHEQKEIWG